MRAFISTVLIIVAALSLASCDDTETQKSKLNETNEDIQIALVMKTMTNPFFISMEQGARKAEKELGISLVVKTAAQETSSAQQISIVERLVREDNVKAIVIAPASSIRLIPVLKKAQEKGIHIINLDNLLDPDFSAKAELNNVPFISIDNKRSAYLSVKQITDGISTPSEVAIIEGIREAANANARKAGALLAFSENSNLTVVASETANWSIEEAYELTKKMFTDHPNISFLFCANDMMALGAIEYLKETNRRSVKVTAFDGIDEARAAINEGWLHATVDQQPEEQGYQGIVIALKAIKGESIPKEIMLDGLVISE